MSCTRGSQSSISPHAPPSDLMTSAAAASVLRMARRSSSAAPSASRRESTRPRSNDSITTRRPRPVASCCSRRSARRSSRRAVSVNVCWFVSSWRRNASSASQHACGVGPTHVSGPARRYTVSARLPPMRSPRNAGVEPSPAVARPGSRCSCTKRCAPHRPSGSRHNQPYDACMAIDDELLNKVTWKIPNALALIGSRSGDERNAMTASWITQLSMEPVLIGVAVDNTAVTCRLISDGGSFTVNLWDAGDTRVFVKFSKPAVDDGSTLNGRAVRSADHRCSRVRRGRGVDGLRSPSPSRPRQPHTVRR